AGVNFHGGLGVCGAPLFNGKFQLYTPICAADDADAQAKVYRAAPEYYGLLMATRLGSGPFLPVTVASDRNVTAYAVRGGDGRIRLAVIEKDDPAAPPVHLSIGIGRRHGAARVLHLTGPSLTGTDGVAIQGGTVDRLGRLHIAPADRAEIRDGTLDLTIPAGSAAVVSFDA